MTEEQRRAVAGPTSAGSPWLALSDEELLFRITSLDERTHQQDENLIAVVKSDRHFFIRQEAAKRVRDAERLKPLAADRHIGQILVRVMRRASDVEYLEKLRAETRYLEVRKAAEAQLKAIAEAQRSRR